MPSKHIEATVIIMIVGAFVSAIMVIAPFVTYSKFYRDLGEDMDFVRSDLVATIGQCSHPNYAVDKNDMLFSLNKDRQNAMIVLIFLGIWMCFSIFIPILILCGVLMTALGSSGNIKENCQQLGSQFTGFIKSYMVFN